METVNQKLRHKRAQLAAEKAKRRNLKNRMRDAGVKSSSPKKKPPSGGPSLGHND
jgi:hypothetical protein